MQSFFLALAALALVALPNLAVADLMISEYVEGSSNNKAVEFFNATNADINLSGYTLNIYFNGNTTAGQSIALAAVVLPPGGVYVLAHTDAAAAILAVADQTSSGVQFNGDDAITLIKISTGGYADSIGQIGFDPGTEWGTGLVSTADNTLRRQMTVCTGDFNPFDVFDPALQWVGFAQDTFDGLGTHVHDCFAISDEDHTWGAVKGLYK
jgi:predicted extracellular nuclease